MPVPSDSGGIGTKDLEKESARQGVEEALCLLGGNDCTSCPAMQSTNSEGGGGRGRKSQLLLNYEVSAERNDEEYTKETSSDGKND